MDSEETKILPAGSDGGGEGTITAVLEPEIWLVRTPANRLHGPYRASRLRNMIQARELGLHDEICPANGYWFSLHEGDELRGQLGVDLPPPERGEDSTLPGQDADATPAIPLDRQELGKEELARPRMLSPPPAPLPVEAPSVLKGFLWLLVSAAALALFFLIKMLRTLGQE